MDRREAVAAVQRVQDYIEAHINEPISLNDLARAAGYSQWHTIRVFRELLGRTPFEYLRALRLSRAAELLREGRVRIVDVALDFVFDSHEGFTRAFSREFGVSPGRYARDPVPLPLFMPARVQDLYQIKQKGEKLMQSNPQHVQTVFVQVMERPARRLILRRGIRAADYFEYCGEVGCEVWETLAGIQGALYEPVGLWLPPNLIREGTSEYVQGVEMPADYAGPVPENFETLDLPACQVMIFQGEPFEDAQFETAIAALWDVMKRYDPTLYGYEWADEEAPRFQLAPMGYRGYIEGRPVRPVNRNAR